MERIVGSEAKDERPIYHIVIDEKIKSRINCKIHCINRYILFILREWIHQKVKHENALSTLNLKARRVSAKSDTLLTLHALSCTAIKFNPHCCIHSRNLTILSSVQRVCYAQAETYVQKVLVCANNINTIRAYRNVRTPCADAQTCKDVQGRLGSVTICDIYHQSHYTFVFFAVLRLFSLRDVI
jgi:hypothetical protein